MSTKKIINIFYLITFKQEHFFITSKVKFDQNLVVSGLAILLVLVKCFPTFCHPRFLLLLVQFPHGQNGRKK